MMLQELSIKLLVVAMMLAVGLELPWVVLRESLRERARLVGAVLLNVIVFPLVVFSLCRALVVDASVALGLMVCAVAPGGPSGPLFARIARADLGFATSLQVTLCFVALLSGPISLELLGGVAGERSLLWPMTWTLALYQLLPLCVGIGLRNRQEALARRLSRPIGVVANVLLVAVIVGMLFARGHILLEQSPTVHALCCALSLVPIGLGFVWPGERPTMIAGGFVTTVRNLSIALLLSASFFADAEVDAAILAWAFYMLVLPAIVAAAIGRVRL
jgi:BASS family bile acid:Na+ symporter